MFLTLLPYLTVAANLIVVLVILLGVSQRVSTMRAQAVKQDKKWQTESARLAAEVAELKGQVLALEQLDRSVSLTAPVAVGTQPAAMPSGSLSNTLRSKVLKMHRLGQTPERIAGALHVPAGEVDLLVKVHKMVMAPYAEGATPLSQDVTGAGETDEKS